MLTPLCRRSWSRCGKTPVLHQRTRHRRKISIIAAVVCTPNGTPRGFVFRLHIDQNITKRQVVDFLRQLRRHYGNRSLTIVWDRLGSHRSPEVRRYAQAHQMELELLPAYAPEFNAVEYSWAYLKMNPLANYAPRETEELAIRSRRAARQIQRRNDLIRSFLAQTPLFF